MTLPADGESVVFVQVDVTDAAGVRDPRATNLIRFSLAGPGEIVAVGNGNPRGLDSFADVTKHPLYFGKAVAVVRRSAGTSAPITLTASADGLTPAQAVLR
jgi:beta-galactosidase